jgi:hypothetical protein
MHKSIASISLLALLAVSPAQAAPTAITACGTISQSGSYELAQNLSANGNCLVITAPYVTIDLRGFTITGAGTGTGILTSQAVGPAVTGITVRHGTVAGFLNAVDLGSTTGAVVEGLRVDTPFFSNGGTGIAALGVVKDNVVTGLSGGVAINTTGKVTDNYVISFGPGMVVGSGSTVIGNTVAATGRGLEVSCPSNVTDNTSAGSAPTQNLVLNGTGCNNTNNVAP